MRYNSGFNSLGNNGCVTLPLLLYLETNADLLPFWPWQDMFALQRNKIPTVAALHPLQWLINTSCKVQTGRSCSDMEFVPQSKSVAATIRILYDVLDSLLFRWMRDWTSHREINFRFKTINMKPPTKRLKCREKYLQEWTYQFKELLLPGKYKQYVLCVCGHNGRVPSAATHTVPCLHYIR